MSPRSVQRAVPCREMLAPQLQCECELVRELGKSGLGPCRDPSKGTGPSTPLQPHEASPCSGSVTLLLHLHRKPPLASLHSASSASPSRPHFKVPLEDTFLECISTWVPDFLPFTSLVVPHSRNAFLFSVCVPTQVTSFRPRITENPTQAMCLEMGLGLEPVDSVMFSRTPHSLLRRPAHHDIGFVLRLVSIINAAISRHHSGTGRVFF